jgi:hypothetical protein
MWHELTISLQRVLRAKSQRFMANGLLQSQSTKNRKHTERRGRTQVPQRNGTYVQHVVSRPRLIIIVGNSNRSGIRYAAMASF